MHYESYTLSNGLRIIHYPSDSPVSYCGFGINAGTRDEQEKEFGMAHFVEHMLFKGTGKRKSWHILNRMEKVGGELNAYTTKEETFVYSIFLEEHFDRAAELLSDLVRSSLFPENEIDKEREVVLDEINSYKDNPSELIYDDFEDLLFAGHEIGHNILGEVNTLESFDQGLCVNFFQRFYVPSNMIFFSMGKTPFKTVVKAVTKYMENGYSGEPIRMNRTSPDTTGSQQIRMSKDLYQTHVVIGTQAYSMFDEKRLGLYLLNNILGGPGMNSRLNLSLREKHGYVYNVESSLTSYTDTGIFSIYFGCDHKYADKCQSLIFKELKNLCDHKLTTSQLDAARKQLIGQLGVSSDNRESISLSMGKSFLHLNKYNSLHETCRRIESLTADNLFQIANEIFEPTQMLTLKYE